MVVIRDYSPAWPLLFAGLHEVVRQTVADISISIEHVGSTAVPGLAAKPVIDIDVVVPAEHLAQGIARLGTLGYVHRGDLGIPQREAFARPEGTTPHHLYLCAADSIALANHLAVRNYLRSHPEAAQSYGELKKRLAQQSSDERVYGQAKTEFLLAILRHAQFDEAHLRQIEQANLASIR
jgi:GrpB-like predicted nucleotidyltransferase (UPF0157 family)